MDYRCASCGELVPEAEIVDGDSHRVTRKHSGHLLDGVEYRELPEWMGIGG